MLCYSEVTRQANSLSIKQNTERLMYSYVLNTFLQIKTKAQALNKLLNVKVSARLHKSQWCYPQIPHADVQEMDFDGLVDQC